MSGIDMPLPDKFALSSKMKRLTMWLDGQYQSEGFIRRQLADTPVGSCYVTIDPERQGPAASANFNRVHLCGRELGFEREGPARLIEMYAEAGVGRFFVWLSPGPEMALVRGWLEEDGFSRVRWTTYPTLCRTGGGVLEFKTDFEVREVDRDEVAAARAWLGETMWPEYARCAGKEGFFHFMAFDGHRPAAVAALGVFEDIGYLMAASTAEADRRRGAQRALIAARIARAEQAGCAGVAVETLSMLEQSHRNLLRAGFREVYDKEVYEWHT